MPCLKRDFLPKNLYIFCKHIFQSPFYLTYIKSLQYIFYKNSRKLQSKHEFFNLQHVKTACTFSYIVVARMKIYVPLTRNVLAADTTVLHSVWFVLLPRPILRPGFHPKFILFGHIDSLYLSRSINYAGSLIPTKSNNVLTTESNLEIMEASKLRYQPSSCKLVLFYIP